MNWKVCIVIGVGFSVLLIMMGGVGEIGAGNVEYSGTHVDIPVGIGSDKIETAANPKVYDGVVDNIKIYNRSITTNEANHLVSANGHTTVVYNQIGTTDIVGAMTEVLGSTTNMMSPLIVLAVVGISLTFAMGIMFRITNTLL
jgi:hypothetical protein